MPRTLRGPQPSSAVATLLEADEGALLDVHAAARAIAPAGSISAVLAAKETDVAALSEQRDHTSTPATPHAGMRAKGESPTIKRELTLTPTADEAFTRLVETFRKTTGTRLTSSHAARALLNGMVQCFPAIEREARRLGRLKLPSNARGREAEREHFERQIARALVAGIRASPALEDD